MSPFKAALLAATCACLLPVTYARSETTADPVIHESWLVRPLADLEPATCDDTGCQCENQRYDYQKRVDTRLSNALASLPSSWEFFSDAKRRSDEANRPTIRFPAMIAAFRKAACRISIHQETVRRYYPHVWREVEASHIEAAARIDDIEGRCPKPDETGWTQSQAAKDYVRCRSRIRSELNRAVREKRPKAAMYQLLRSDLERLAKPRE